MSITDMPEGATPLTNDDLVGLIPSHYNSRAQLDAHEQANIIQARSWALKSRKLRKELLTATGIMLLHKRMFDETWEWAGTFRKVQTNIGVDPLKVPGELQKLVGDIQYWVENTTYDEREIAVRFHHKLVWIHPFPNGNGRHARLAADLLLYYRGLAPLSWGGHSLSDSSQTRKKYISALRSADRRNIQPLLVFADS